MKCLYEEETDMRYTLENENLKVEIDSFGAEIKSVKRKSDNFEYMWCGDKKYWGRTSPVLFPFVGAPKNKEYRYDGKTYTMGQHGFARDMEFTLEAQTEENISFVLTDTAETCENIHFILRCTLVMNCAKRGESKLDCGKHRHKRIIFSIGAHPAFNCPVHGEENKTGYGLKFGGLADTIHHHGNTPDGMAVMEDKVLALKDGCVTFTEGFFDECTYMVEGKQTGEVSLLDREGIPYVTVKFDTPLFAVWSPEGKMHLSSALNHGTEDAMPQILPAHCSSATTKTCCRRAEHSRQLIVLHICKIESAKGGS